MKKKRKESIITPHFGACATRRMKLPSALMRKTVNGTGDLLVGLWVGWLV